MGASCSFSSISSITHPQVSATSSSVLTEATVRGRRSYCESRWDSRSSSPHFFLLHSVTEEYVLFSYIIEIRTEKIVCYRGSILDDLSKRIARNDGTYRQAPFASYSRAEDQIFSSLALRHSKKDDSILSEAESKSSSSMCLKLVHPLFYSTPLQEIPRFPTPSC